MIKRFDKKENLGITLIALVVTIIVLLILAGVTIGFVMNGTGLFEKAKLATDKYNNKVQQEDFELGKTSNEIDNYINGDRTINSKTPSKVLFDTPTKSGTATFSENTIDDFEFYEFIFGGWGIGSGTGRICSEIVSKDFLKLANTAGDQFYIDGSGGGTNHITISITNVSNNTITFECYISGTSWGSYPNEPKLYKIIGRNF